MHKDRGAGRCFIWVTYELKRSKAKRNGRIMHLSEEQFVTILFIFLFSGFVVGPSPLCLFVLFCFSLPCAKRRWNHFVLQRVGKIPTANVLRLSLSMIAKRSSAIFAAGQTRRAEASENESLLDVWLPVDMGKMWGDEMLCSLRTRCSTKKPFNIYLSPLKKGNPFSLRHVNHDGARMDNMNTHLTRVKEDSSWGKEGNEWWNSFIDKMTTGSSRDRAGRRLKREGEAEIGEGLWVTGRLWLPLASGWSSLSSGSAVEWLHYQPDPERVGASEPDTPRSQLVSRVRDFKKGDWRW